jgi:anti-anti-sigma regulatory factor
MAIVDYRFEDGIFYAREVGQITLEEAKEWARRLQEAAASHPTPIAAVVDALEVKRVDFMAQDVFSKASFTPRVLGIAVATTVVVSGTAQNIGLLGRKQHTAVFRTLAEAESHARQLVAVE